MKQITKRVVAFFAAMGLMVSGLSLNEPASADAKAKAKVKSVTIKNFRGYRIVDFPISLRPTKVVRLEKRTVVSLL